MELTLLDVIADTLDGTKGWRTMETKELASVLKERVEGYYEVREARENGWDNNDDYDYPEETLEADEY